MRGGSLAGVVQSRQGDIGVGSSPRMGERMRTAFPRTARLQDSGARPIVVSRQRLAASDAPILTVLRV